MAVWDTSVASGLHPDDPLFELASEAALANEPFLLAAPTVQEIAFGLERQGDARFAALLAWFKELFAVGMLEVLPLSWEAALLAGQLRALLPIPPTGSTAHSALQWHFALGWAGSRANIEARVATTTGRSLGAKSV